MQPPPRSYKRAEIKAGRQANLADSIARIRAFAEHEGLSVIETHSGRRLVRLEGTLAALQAALGTQRRQYEQEGHTFRARVGGLTVSADVAAMIEAVLGPDQRPLATPKAIRLAHPNTSAGFLPNQSQSYTAFLLRQV